jgi:hypothetical protein
MSGAGMVYVFLIFFYHDYNVDLWQGATVHTLDSMQKQT